MPDLLMIESDVDKAYETAVALDDASTHDEMVDVVFSFVNELCVNGQFDLVDRLIGLVDFDTASVQLLEAILVATRPAKWELKNRKDFYKRCWEKVGSTRSKKRTEGLLLGLE